MKDTLGREIQTSEEIVTEAKEKYLSQGNDDRYAYAYACGVLQSKYDFLKLDLEMLNERYQKLVNPKPIDNQ